MRRENRRKKEDNFNTLIYVSGGILVIAIVAFIVTFIMYSNKLKQQEISIDTEKIAQIVPNDEGDESEEASTSIGKTVEESQNNITEENIQTTVENTISENKTNSVSNKNTEKKEEKKDLKFAYPIEGDISKEYAKDNLIYSETLKEWITHLGIDIKAEKASVVKASEDGNITSIKNDPRYGLTAEFVKIGEEVKKGQTIATVGGSAAFEITDESHLHFEILKDNVYLNPTEYLR